MATTTRTDTEVRTISTKSADDFRFRSKLKSPIGELGLLRRGLLFAETAMISYLTPEQCNRAAGKLGFTGGSFFSVRAAQAYWFWNDHDSVIVFRGTEPNCWNDIKADANAIAAVAETVGRVHRGFKEETDLLWPALEEALAENKKPLWFTGHSLGGAMATICAQRCLLSHIRSEPAELHTFGSPRVGCRRYISHTPIDHYRWVNNNDVVTRVPPVWLGYRHGGSEIYFDRFGRISPAKGWLRFADRFRGFVSGLARLRIDQLSDHSTLDYIDYLHEAVRREEAGETSGLEKINLSPSAIYRSPGVDPPKVPAV